MISPVADVAKNATTFANPVFMNSNRRISANASPVYSKSGFTARSVVCENHRDRVEQQRHVAVVLLADQHQHCHAGQCHHQHGGHVERSAVKLHRELSAGWFRFYRASISAEIASHSATRASSSVRRAAPPPVRRSVSSTFLKSDSAASCCAIS